MSSNSSNEAMIDPEVGLQYIKSKLISRLDKMLIILMVCILLTLSLPVALVTMEQYNSRQRQPVAAHPKVNTEPEKPTFQTKYSPSESNSLRIYED